jgi:predicted transcriptional regulator
MNGPTASNPIELAAEIVAAYISNNAVPAAELPALINSVFSALTQAVAGKAEEPKVELIPAVPVKKSVTPDYIICLDDGKKFKSLKRHLRTTYDMTPERYHAKWNLPSDYPMVAPNYAKARSELARTMGLGQARKGRLASAKSASTSTKATAAAKRRRAKEAG